jgi:hypothetical protein
MPREASAPRCANCGHPRDRHMMPPGTYDRNKAGACNVGWDRGEIDCACRAYRRPKVTH